jgi:hypothetical protein
MEDIKMRFEDIVPKFDPETMITAADGKSARGKCPAHDGKSAGSLSITKGANGRAQIHCFGGCTAEEVLAAVGIDPAEFYAGDSCSLEKFSDHTGIPVFFLKQRGLSDGFFRYGKDNRIPAVVIPYLKEDGTPDTCRYRINNSGDKFRWKTGSKARNKLYGAEHLAQLDPKYIIVDEGESDTLTLSYSGFQAVGLPGASSFDGKVLAERLQRFEEVYFIIEPDAGGETVLKRLHGAGDAFLDKVRLISLTNGCKDPNQLFKLDPENFVSAFTAAMVTAKPVSEFLGVKAAIDREEHYKKAESLIQCPDILSRFAVDVRRAGLVGEERNAKILFLAQKSRRTDAPVNIVVMGQSAAGKNYLVKSVTRFAPEQACKDISAMSEKALLYMEDPLCHRHIFISEAPGLDNDFLNYIVRTLLSEKQLVYFTVERIEGHLSTIEKRVPGPTGLITTTTRLGLHPENSTRCQFLSIDDSASQTALVIAECMERGEHRCDVDFAMWHSLDEWLAGAVLVATVPFRKAIAQNLPPTAVRLRRDAEVIRTLICTHAILHQANREVDAAGRVVATVEDYRAVHGLLADLIAEQSSSGINAGDREFFDLVRQTATVAEDSSATSGDGGDFVTVAAMVAATKKDQPWTSRRLRKLVKAGYLVKDTKRREHRYFVADPLTEDFTSILPPPEIIERWITENGAKVEPDMDADRDADLQNPVPLALKPVPVVVEAPFEGMTF